MNTVLAQTGPVIRGDTSLELVTGVLLFIIAGFLMAFAALVAGRLLRPTLKHPEKSSIYECGEPTIGESWVQFDLRFYVVALVFIIFDVEIALFWPWAVVFGSADATTADGMAIKLIALYDMLFFFGVVVVGFLFLWRFGYLDWVRASTGQRRTHTLKPAASTGVGVTS
jgi:NADH-quinone oxidoreductase subunit A